VSSLEVSLIRCHGVSKSGCGTLCGQSSWMGQET
jgi:hypothetical protein